MSGRKLFVAFTLGLAALPLAVAVTAAAARQPLALPQVGATFAAPYDAVWAATLRSLGIVKLPVADKATGRIETEQFSFAFPIGSGQGGNTQVLWIALRIEVSRAGNGRTNVRVQPLVHDALLYGLTPGPTNNPWADLFAKIRAQLGPHR